MRDVTYLLERRRLPGAMHLRAKFLLGLMIAKPVSPVLFRIVGRNLAAMLHWVALAFVEFLVLS